MDAGRKGPKGQQAGCEPAVCPCSKEAPQQPSLHKEEHHQHTEGEHPSPLLSHPECCSGLPRTGPKRDKELLQQGQLKFMEVSKGLEHFSYEERL